MLPNVVTSHSTHAGGSGSGGTSETPSQLSRISGKTRLRVNGAAAACTPGRKPGRCERSECVRLPAPVLSGEPVLGAFLLTNELTEFGD